MSNVARAAGRGSLLRTQRSNHIPCNRAVGRDAERPKPNKTQGAGRGGGTPESPHSVVRSALASSVLNRRDQGTPRPQNDTPYSQIGWSSNGRRSQPNGNGTGYQKRSNAWGDGNRTHGERARYEFDMSSSKRLDGRSQRSNRKPAMVDWYSSTARAEALENFAVLSAQPPKPENASDEVDTVPFAWGDVSTVLSQLPENHWATSYVENVAYTLEGNPAISASDKQRILNETLATLSALSSVDAASTVEDDAVQEERYCDA